MTSVADMTQAGELPWGRGRSPRVEPPGVGRQLLGDLA